MNTENNKIENPLEVIIIDSDEETVKKKTKHRHKKKYEHKRIVKIHHTKKDELIISQRVKVNKNKLNYVINVNTNISEAKSHDRKQNKHSHKHKRNKHGNTKYNNTYKEVVKHCKDKIVPDCLRRQCVSLIRCKARDCQEKKDKRRDFSGQNSSKNRHNKEEPRRPKYKHRNKPYSNNLLCKSDMLSPISTSSLRADSPDEGDVKPKSVISYDDVSLDSLPFTSDKLDRLIMRTKQRERKMQATSTISRQAMEQHTPRLNPEDETLTIFSGISATSIHSKSTLVLERKLDDTIYSPLHEHLDFSDNLSDKANYKPYINKYSTESPEIKNNTSLDCMDILKGYLFQNDNKTETYKPDSIKEFNVYSNNYSMQENKFQLQDKHIKSEYPAPALHNPNYLKPGYNHHPFQLNVISENTSHSNFDLPSSYFHPDSYYITQSGNINFMCKPENYTLPPNEVDYIINSSDYCNAYTDVNNYPVELHKAPLSGGVHYDKSTMLTTLTEDMTAHPAFNYNPVIDSHVTDNNQINCSYYPVKLESWTEGYN